MILNHVTTMDAWRLIKEDDRLRVDKSEGQRQAVWLVDDEHVEWAIVHVLQKRMIELARCCVIRLLIDDESVRCGPRKGLFYVLQDIPLAMIHDFMPAGFYGQRGY